MSVRPKRGRSCSHDGDDDNARLKRPRNAVAQVLALHDIRVVVSTGYTTSHGGDGRVLPGWGLPLSIVFVDSKALSARVRAFRLNSLR